MQLDKLIHIARLIDKKYFLSYIFAMLFSLLSLIVLDTNWASLDLRLEVDTPLFKTTIPASGIFLKGWDVMGFFGVFSFFPIIFIFFKSLKKKAWIKGEGCLFLMIDFKDEANPIIHVRAWQKLEENSKCLQLGNFRINDKTK